MVQTTLVQIGGSSIGVGLNGGGPTDSFCDFKVIFITQNVVKSVFEHCPLFTGKENFENTSIQTHYFLLLFGNIKSTLKTAFEKSTFYDTGWLTEDRVLISNQIDVRIKTVKTELQSPTKSVIARIDDKMLNLKRQKMSCQGGVSM